jgi:hypothetical protein
MKKFGNRKTLFKIKWSESNKQNAIWREEKKRKENNIKKSEERYKNWNNELKREREENDGDNI